MVAMIITAIIRPAKIKFFSPGFVLVFHVYLPPSFSYRPASSVEYQTIVNHRIIILHEVFSFALVIQI